MSIPTAIDHTLGVLAWAFFSSARPARPLRKACVPRDIAGAQERGDAPRRFRQVTPTVTEQFMLTQAEPTRRSTRRRPPLGTHVGRQRQRHRGPEGPVVGAVPEFAREPGRFMRRKSANGVKGRRVIDMIPCRYGADLPDKRRICVHGMGPRHGGSIITPIPEPRNPPLAGPHRRGPPGTGMSYIHLQCTSQGALPFDGGLGRRTRLLDLPPRRPDGVCRWALLDAASPRK